LKEYSIFKHFAGEKNHMWGFYWPHLCIYKTAYVVYFNKVKEHYQKTKDFKGLVISSSKGRHHQEATGAFSTKLDCCPTKDALEKEFS